MDEKKLGGLLLLIGLCFLLAACTTSLTEPTSTPTALPQPSDALIRFRGDYFSTAGECGYCHTGMKDAKGNDVSIDTSWRSSMMANAARDPYYRASVRSEVLGNPEQRDVIEEKCSVCHMGMAFTTVVFSGDSPKMLPDQGFLAADHPLYPLALDGVSCTLCHQVLETNFGDVDSFSGGYLIDKATPQGQREIYGRFAVDPAMANIMSAAAGFNPVQADYVQQSELCATCHNLFTPYIDNQGNLSTELFPEQTPHLEWLQSSYTESASCQTCHMPVAAGATFIANTGSPAREPFFQHLFIGGNAYMIDLLKDNSLEMKVSAQPDQFEKTAAETLTNLSQRTATLYAIGEISGNEALIQVTINSMTGHKFPTSYPSRRAWLHLILKDSSGNVLFESGAWTENGEIISNDNDQDSSLFEPHFIEINQPDQVQIYEAIMGDPDGKVTTSLLRAKSYLKDNRLLPVGFAKNNAPQEVAVVGDALQDQDFTGGEDTILYRIDLTNSNGPFTVEIEFLYQSIGFRWAEKFRNEDNPEASEFYGYTDGNSNKPILIATETFSLP